MAVVAAGFTVGAQAYFFHRYGAYLNARAVLVGTSMMPSVGQQLWSDRSSFLRAVLPPLAIAAALPLLLARFAPPRPARARIALDLACFALLLATFHAAPTMGGEQAATPDILYLSSMGTLAEARWDGDAELARAHPGARTPLPVPPLTRRAGPRRNVLLVVNESVRAEDSCVAFDPGCLLTPFTNAAAKERLPFRQMRSLDSTTAVSLAVLWSGLPPTATRAELHTLPLAWEYAHAAGMDTAYETSQNLFFANAGLWLDGLPLTRFVSATDLEPDPTFETGADDGKLVDSALRDLATLKEPYFFVLHLSNTHFPYVVDEKDLPFLPQGGAVGSGDAELVRNRYDDAIHAQDKHLGRLLRELRATPAGARTVVLYVSDHGEQIRERGAIGHTYSVHDEELHVAAWLDAPEGTISADERAALGALGDVPLTHLDVMPTLLDLFGVLDAMEIAPYRAKMPGESLLRGGSPPDRPVVLTNCTELFACAFKNWGAMRGTLKLMATQNDDAWRCYDLRDDPGEEHPRYASRCPGLRELAEGSGRGTPF
jgi:glucan phosphoethanolaminetransferase (alkaline phosphatase superfamily)